MTLPLKPKRGGFLRPFGYGEFIRDFLLGKGPFGSPKIAPNIGVPQSDICKHYKLALMREIALDRATRFEEKTARKENRTIDPEKIQALAEEILERLATEVLGFPPELASPEGPLALLRQKLALEPSITGSKSLS